MTARRGVLDVEPTVADLLEAVESLRRDQPAEAWGVLQRQWRTASRQATDAERGGLWRSRGHLMRDLDRMPEAVTAYRRAHRYFRQAGEPVEAAMCSHGLLDALMYLGAYADAQKVARAGARTLREHGENASLARLLNNHANLLHRLDRHAQALDMYSEARAALGRNAFGRAVIDVNLGNCLSSVGRCAEARRRYVSAGRTFTHSGHAVRALNADYNLAYMDFLEHRHERALAGLAAVRERATGAQAASIVALVSLDRAEILLRLGADYDAVAEARAAVAALAPLGLRYETAKARLFAALADFRLGRRQSARGELADALREFVDERNDVWIGEALVGLATVWRQDSAPDAAVALLAAANRRFRAAGDLERAACAIALGARARLEAGDRYGAERMVHSLQPRMRGASPRLRHLVWAADAECAIARGDLRGARRLLLQAARESERLASRILDEQWRASFWGDWGWPHAALAELEIRMGRPRHAIEALERGRGRALLAPLTGRRAAARDDDDELRQWAIAHRHADRTVRSWTPPTAQAPTPVLTTSGRARLRSRPADDPALPAIQRALAPGTVLIDFMIADGWLRGFRVTGDAVVPTEPLAPERVVQALIESVVFDLRSAALMPLDARARSASLTASLEELASVLLWPALAGAGPAPREVAVVSTGLLSRVPWPALPGPDGRPLCEAAAISILPGLRLAFLHPPARPAASAVPLMVASPAGDPGYAEEEIDLLSALFPQAEVLRGAAATVARVREAGRHAAWIHIAGHGAYSAADPGASGLRLADGWLTLDDLARYRTRARWVALSACQSARALVRPGEEWFGLSRGFLAAGAGQVLAAQWDVEGWAAASLMRTVYGGVAGGQSLRHALAAAQAAAAQAGAHPVDWAGFCALGAPRDVLS